MFVSELFAIGASICIALSSMLVTELNGRVDVFRLVRWNMVAAAVMTGAVSLAIGGWRSLTVWQIELLAWSGLFGIIIATTTYYATIYSIGPRNTALLFSLTSPFALVLAYVFLGETISLQQACGVALVLCGIVLAIGRPRRESKGVAWGGIALGVITALGQATGSMLARPAMAAGAEPFTAMAVRAGIAAVVFVLATRLPLPALRRPYRFSGRDLGTAVAAAFAGTGLGMSLLMAALAHGHVGTVSTLSSMTPVVILPMSWVRSGVSPPVRAWIGAVLAVAGTAAISLA